MTDWSFPVTFSHQDGFWIGKQKQLGIAVLHERYEDCRKDLLREIREVMDLGARVDEDEITVTRVTASYVVRVRENHTLDEFVQADLPKKRYRVRKAAASRETVPLVRERVQAAREKEVVRE